MAVATHVSRVAKDYAPFGYSIMESRVITLTSTATTPLSTQSYAVMVEDADIYIESVQVIGIDGINAGGTNYVEVGLISWGSGGAAGAQHCYFTTDSGTPGHANLVENEWFKLGVTGPVVAAGRYLVVEVEKSTNHSDVNSKRIGVAIRYRRKA